MVNAGAEVPGVSADGVQGLRDRREQYVGVRGAAVGEQPLGELPDAFVGVEFWRVAGKANQMEARNALSEGPHEATGVRRPAVPQEVDVPAQMPEQVLQEAADLLLSDVLEVELEVEVEPPPLRTDGDRRDGRDAIATIEVPDDRGLTDRRPGLGDCRSQEEARFIGEDDVGTQPRGVFFTSGQVSRFQRSIASSSRSSARRSGFWQLQPSERIRRPT